MAWQLFDAWPDRALMPVDAGDAHAIAGAYDAYFDDVFDLASRLSASKEEAAAIARAATVRLFEGRMVRGRGDDGARFVAGAYHEAATMSERATQPVSAGTHTLAPELVDAVNAHVARCRTCRRWGPIEGAAQPRAGRSEPELKAQIWREVAPVVEAPARSFEPHSDARRLAARAELSTDHRRWLGVAGAAGLVALAAIVVGALAVGGGGGDGGDGRANLEAFASSGDERTPTPASTSGGGASASDTSNATSGSADERSAGDDAVPRDGDSVADDAASGPDGSIGTGAGDANGDGIVDAPSSGHGPDAGSGAGGSSGDTNSQSGGGANEGAPAVTTPAPPSGEPTTASAPAATSTPAPVSTPPPASTPVPVATATSAPPPPPPTQPPGPPPPEPTSVIDLLPVVPTVVGALPTLPPVLGEGG